MALADKRGFGQTVLKTVAADKVTVSLMVVALLGVTGSAAHAEKAPVGPPSNVATDPETPRIVLKWFDTYELFTTPADIMAKHVVSIFERIGVSVIWDKGGTILAGPAGDARPAGNAELELRIFLRPSEPESLGLPANAMGAILNNKSPQRTLFIFFPTLARALGYKPKDLIGQPLRGGGQELVLARAMSRVVAHEVIHAIAPALPHAPGGLTRERLGLDGLAHSKAVIDPRSAAVFREELAKQLTVQAEKVAAYPPPVSGSPAVVR